MNEIWRCANRWIAITYQLRDIQLFIVFSYFMDLTRVGLSINC